MTLCEIFLLCCARKYYERFNYNGKLVLLGDSNRKELLTKSLIR